MNKYAIALLLFILLTGCSPVTAQNSAFPGAEGFGKNTIGGRGGQTIIVSNLHDDGPGSLREAIGRHGPRIITFAISGNIDLQSALPIDNDNITIAGQSAPGDGICIRYFPVRISANNVILRYLRFRLGDVKKTEDDAINGRRSDHVIVDHCSMSWSTDECASFYGNKNFTLQWCIISESLNNSVHHKGKHGYGGIWGGIGASFHHNLIAHHTSRNPRFSGSSTTSNSSEELTDFRNNVIYNWNFNSIYGGEKGRYNMVNNYFKAGPATDDSKRDRIVNPSEPYGTFYVKGNYVFDSPEVTADNWSGGVQCDNPAATRTDQPFEVVRIEKTQTARDAFEEVLQNAGASFHRDAVDRRIVNEVRNGTATYGNGIINSQETVGGWPELNSETPSPDQDKDGMPDSWEREKGLDPANGKDGATKELDPDYSNVEVYLNGLVAGVNNSEGMARKMADSEIQRTPDLQYLDLRDKPKWEYTNGLIATAMLKLWKETGDEKYVDYVKAYADSMIDKNGEIDTYKQSDYNIDRVNPGKFLIELYKVMPQENYRKAIERLRNQMREHPRTTEGGFWHKKRYPYQMWLDGIYMGSPFLAKYAVNFEEPELLNDVANQIYLIDKHNYDSATGLYYHGWDESKKQKWANKKTGLSKNFWGRGMGWLAMALVDVLDYFPADHPKRPMIVAIAKKLASGIIRYQDKSGTWYQVVNMGEKEGNYLESSASAMFTYFLLKGIEQGTLDSSYLPYAEKAYKGMLENFIEKNADGSLSITHACAVAGLGGDPFRSGTFEYYINETKRDNDPKAVGPFIMASLLYENRIK